MADTTSMRPLLFSQSSSSFFFIFFVLQDVLETGVSLVGVFDGHGDQGHLVAQKVRDSLPLLLLKYHGILVRSLGTARRWRTRRGAIPVDGAGAVMPLVHLAGAGPAAGVHRRPRGVYPGVYQRPEVWQHAHRLASEEMEKDLRLYPGLDAGASGCAALTAWVHHGLAVVANLGNCRCVVGATSKVGNLYPLQLTVDHVPSLGTEKARLEAAGEGCLVPAEEQLTGRYTERLWLPEENSPGLGVSRAFGDWRVKPYGLSGEPQVHTFPIVPSFKFLVLASPGVWEVLSNEEAVRVVSKARYPQRAGGELVKAAARKWRAQHSERPWSKREDMSAVVLFLNK